MTTTYIVYWIRNDARRDSPTGSLAWSLPFASLGEAGHWAKGKVDDGLATMACVYAFDGDGPGQLVRSSVVPGPARKVIQHYLEISTHAADGPPPTTKGRE